MTATPTARTLPLQVQRQAMTEWCWAAVSVSVNLLYRPDATHTQCELAGDTLKLTIKAKKGVVAAQVSKFTVALKKGDFAAKLAR